jgi:hypothetical protein
VESRKRFLIPIWVTVAVIIHKACNCITKRANPDKMTEIGLMEPPATKKQAIGAECEREHSYLATKSIDYESDTKAKFTGFN